MQVLGRDSFCFGSGIEMVAWLGWGMILPDWVLSALREKRLLTFEPNACMENSALSNLSRAWDLCLELEPLLLLRALIWNGGAFQVWNLHLEPWNPYKPLYSELWNPFLEPCNAPEPLRGTRIPSLGTFRNLYVEHLEPYTRYVV